MNTQIELKKVFRLRDGLWSWGTFSDEEEKLFAEARKDPRALGLRLFKQKKYHAATPILELAAEKNPDDFEVRMALGLSLAGTSRWANAEPHFAKAVELNPQSAEAHFEYGEILLKVGKFLAAEEQFHAVLPVKGKSWAAKIRSFFASRKKIAPHLNPQTSDPETKLAFATARREAIERAARAVEIGKPNRTWRNSERGRKFKIRNTPLIKRDTRILTIGSCFALEIRHELRRRGFDVFPKYTDIAFDEQTQILDSLPDRDNINHYDTFTIRQEFEQAFASTHFKIDDFWTVSGRPINRVMKRDVVWQDPYRKNVYAADESGIVEASRKIDDCIRDGIMRADVYVITLGLIETWKNTANGLHACVYPGIGGGASQSELHIAGFAENYENLRRVCELVFERFPEKHIIVTVSPVALESTFRDIDVVVANCESKSTLRAVAGQICREFPNVHYFPSYEIFQYHDLFHDNGRHVTRDGVNVVVDVFAKCFLDPNE